MQSARTRIQPFNGNCRTQTISTEKLHVDPRNEPLLPASTGTSTTKLLWLHTSWVCNQQCSVICHQLLFQLHSAGCIDIFCVIRNDSFRNRLTDGVYLRGVSSSLDTHTDIEHGELIFASDKNGLINFEAEDFRMDNGNRRAIDTDETPAFFSMGNRSCSLENESKIGLHAQ